MPPGTWRWPEKDKLFQAGAGRSAGKNRRGWCAILEDSQAGTDGQPVRRSSRQHTHRWPRFPENRSNIARFAAGNVRVYKSGQASETESYTNGTTLGGNVRISGAGSGKAIAGAANRVGIVGIDIEVFGDFVFQTNNRGGLGEGGVL